MSRISVTFQQLKESGKTALIPYITAGDPGPSVTVGLMHRLVDSGADVIELGIPFSDPMADGPVIQRAAERALEHHVSLHDVLDMVREFRSDNDATPIVLMGYLNPIEVMGYENFAREAAAAGVDGVLTVDLPPEEADEMLKALEENGLDPIFLIAPTSTPERIKRICDVSRGYVYYVSVKGITGAGHLDIDAVAEKLKEVRALTDLPVGVGFGIKSGETAARMSAIADAVVVGSAIVSRIENAASQPDTIANDVGTFVETLSQALNR